MIPNLEREYVKDITMTPSIESFIDAQSDQLLDFTARLVATPSPNLPGDERAVVEVIRDELTRLELEGAEIVGKFEHGQMLCCGCQVRYPDRR